MSALPAQRLCGLLALGDLRIALPDRFFQPFIQLRQFLFHGAELAVLVVRVLISRKKEIQHLKTLSGDVVIPS
jgi:hypothetical protein